MYKRDEKAIAAAKADEPDADKSRKVYAGVGHNTLGFAYLKQEKTAAAIPELKAAAALLKGQEDQQYGRGDDIPETREAFGEIAAFFAKHLAR